VKKQDKFIACFLIFQAVVGAAAFALMALSTPPSLGLSLLLVSLILGALVAGIGSFARKRWAAVLGLVVFAAQTPILASPYARYSAWLGIHLDLIADLSDQGSIGVNVVGLLMLLWSSIRFGAADTPFKTP
jgi:hypothetical protein